MSRRYRTKLKILRDFLLAASKERKKTRIMYAADMNPLTFKKYLSDCMEQGLIRCKNNEYFTTEKGFKTLNMCERILEKIEEIETLVK
jgi:predicted transcriptional regulator